jgi:hypothetical protein
VVLLVAVALVAVVGVAFAAGRGSTPHQATPAPLTQGNLGSQFSGMMPWMQGHVHEIAWMQAHMGDVTWMRNHWGQWQWMQAHVGDVSWMQTHPLQWRWMGAHMGDIGWMHDHWGQWDQWRSGIGSGSATWNGGNNHTGWSGNDWNWGR